MISAGQRLSVVDRLNEAALSETERCVLQAIARALARYSYDDDWYREEFGSGGALRRRRAGPGTYPSAERRFATHAGSRRRSTTEAHYEDQN
jgi:hypothetical protein